MIRRLIGGVTAASLALAFSASVALAAQPFAECGDEGATVTPAGFSSDGFANAEERYAGNGNSVISDNWHAVSQYDVACYQLTQHAH
jgi:hypothetical protein